VNCLVTLEGGSCTVPETVVTVLCTPDDGCGWHPKHVEWTCRIINRLLCVAFRWTIIKTPNKILFKKIFSLPSGPYINTLCIAVDGERYSVFIADRRIPVSGHQWRCCCLKIRLLTQAVRVKFLTPVTQLLWMTYVLTSQYPVLQTTKKQFIPAQKSSTKLTLCRTAPIITFCTIGRQS